jgi:hypothetical protein
MIGTYCREKPEPQGDESTFLATYLRQLETLTNVVHSIGTNGLPYYLDWIEHRPPKNPPYEEFRDSVARISRDHIHLPERQDRTREGVTAIQILGPDARAAIIPLGRLLENGSSCGAAALCLSAIGPESIPTLTDVLANSTNPRVRYCVIEALGDLGPACRPAKAALLWTRTPRLKWHSCFARSTDE